MVLSPVQKPLQDLQRLLPLLACPWDKSALHLQGDSLSCEKGHSFEVDQGVPVLLDTAPGKSKERGTVLFEETPQYFERLHEKRVKEWRVLPFKSQDIKGPGWLLDVGSGSGTWALSNARRGMPSVGVEISKSGALFGARLARELGIENCFFVAGDATQLPFKSGAFHWATNYTAIEHIYDPEKCIAEMARITHPQGRLLINTINNFTFLLKKGKDTIPEFLHHAGRYMAKAFSPSAAPVKIDSSSFRDPATVTYETWSSGEDVDLYEAVSHEMLDLCSRYVDVQEYYTFSYPPGPDDYRFGPDLAPTPFRLSLSKRLFYPILRAFNHIPFLRHIGKTITIVGRPKNG